MKLKLAESYKGGNNSLKLDPHSLNEALKQPFWMKEDEALHIIMGHLENFQRPHIATSWGKDSTVMAHLVIRACKELGIEPESEKFPIFAIADTRNTYKEEKPYWDEIIDFLGIPKKKHLIFVPKGNTTVWTVAKKHGHLPMQRKSTKQLGFHAPFKFRATPECCDELKKEGLNDWIKSMPDEYRFDLSMHGSRASENQNRRLNVLLHCRTYDTSSARHYKIRTVIPIAFLTQADDPQAKSRGWNDDIGQYFEKYKIPLNPAYEAHDLTRLGCQSCTAFKTWTKNQIKDPTGDSQKLLLLNLRVMRVTQPNRFVNECAILRKENMGEEIIQTSIKLPLLKEWSRYNVMDYPLSRDAIKLCQDLIQVINNDYKTRNVILIENNRPITSLTDSEGKN